MKRGQTTIFVILGIIIVVMSGMGYFLKDSIMEKVTDLGIVERATLPPEFEEKQAQIEECLSELLGGSVQAVATQGGYADVAPRGSLMYGETPVAYLFDQGENRMPTLEQVAEEIGGLVEEDAPACIESLDLPEPSKSSAKVKIEADKVTAEIKMPTKVTISGTTETMDDFKASAKIELARSIQAAGQIVENNLEDPESLCLTCLNDVAVAYGLSISLDPSAGQPLVVLTNEGSMIFEEEPFIFMFAMKY